MAVYASIAFATGSAAGGVPVKSRVSVLLASAGHMLLTPEQVTFPETCALVNFNGCTAAGNPTAAQEICNACVADTIHYTASCASNWTSFCQTTYAQCVKALTGQTACSQSLNIVNGMDTRGDGSAETPGCDLNGDGKPNDSRIYQSKEALWRTVASYGELEFSLWRFAQLTGGQPCVTSATCPKTPGGLAPFSCSNVGAAGSICVLDAATLDSTPTTVGQCHPYTWNGAAASFACSQCDFATSYERAACDAYGLERARTGAVSLLNGTSTVNCALPSTNHPFIKYAGAFNNNGACDPNGAERLVDFPSDGFSDNYAAIASWIDGQEAPIESANEIKANGGTPLGASLRDMRTSTLAELAADPKTPCRRRAIVLITGAGDGCEKGTAVTAAQNLQNLSFTAFNGTPVSGYAVPVHVIAFGPCPAAQPNCPVGQELDAIAFAGGTTAARRVLNGGEMQAALAAIADGLLTAETCAAGDSNCDGDDNEDYTGLGASCTVGVGACTQTGTLVCAADTMHLQCSATAGGPSAETCNLIDDNCNGLADEGVNQCLP
jgi:hypothetical protein